MLGIYLKDFFANRLSLKSILKHKNFEESDYTKYVDSKKLIILREIIRGCVLSEKFTLENRSANSIPKLFLHVNIEISSQSVEELLFSAKIVKYMILSEKNRKKLVYPLKISWIQVFNKHGVNVNRTASFLQYCLYKVRSIAKRYWKAFKINSFCKSNPIKDNEKKIVVQIPSYVSDVYVDDPNMYSFVKWIKDQKLSKVATNIHYLSNSRIFQSPQMFNLSNIINFGFFKTIRNFFELFSLSPLRFVKSFLLAPNSILEYVNLDEDILKNVEILIIPSSESWIKTAWHLRAEEFGTKIIYINLSDSSEPSMSFDAKFPVSWIPLSNWSNIFVCSHFQQNNFVKNLPSFGSSKLSLVGVPDWTDRDFPSNSFGNFVSLYDYEPHQGHYGFSCNNDSGYSKIENTIEFINDVVTLTSSLGLTCVLKSKRKIASHKRFSEYAHAIQNLSEEFSLFHIVDENISPRKVIEKSCATVHMPFTSTALISNDIGVPGCFYDVVGRISLDDPASNGIRIINSRNDLHHWLYKFAQLSPKSDT
jgi:polysaccharide biosynthesis PFTS motif protein